MTLLEMEKESTTSKEAPVADVKQCDSDKTSENSYMRNKYQRDFRKDRQHQNSFRGRQNDFRRNQGSYRGGFRNDNSNRKPFKRNWSNSEKDGKRKKMEVGNRLKECDVGITEFIGEQGFFGVIKERYTDFHVNEIALDGETAKLTNQDIPSVAEESETLDDLKQIVSDTIWDQLQTLKEAGSSPIEIDVTNLEKDQRRAIHTIAKKITNVVSQTVDKEGKKIMVILRNGKDAGKIHNFRKDNRLDWNKYGGEYSHFVLHKVNMDTMDALNQLAMNLRMKPNNFNYAGTKDRRAWTTQWVSLRKVKPSEILHAAKSIRGAYVGNFKFDKKPLKLGMLEGNHFRIALRNVNGTDEQIEEAMVSLRDNGFINYYGLQRFGTVAAIPTYEIGKTLLQGKWNEAIELILKPREGEQDRDLAEARKIYETTKDAYAAYKNIRRHDKIEATLLKGLYTCSNNNPQGALDSIPRNARLMYIHAYQSLIWNHMVSRRIREFGKKPIVGDLVYQDNIKQHDHEDFIADNETAMENQDNEDDTENTAESGKKDSIDESETPELSDVLEESKSVSTEEVTDTMCDLKTNETIEEKSSVNEKIEDEKSYNIPAVKILTEEDLPNYTLKDIIMPQVGWKVTYPPYAKPWYDEILAKDGLTTDLRQKNKKYSLGGAYRKILQVPSNLSWKIMRYTQKHSDLIRCDIDEMRNLPPLKDEPEGQFKALIVEISLKSSTYATMALREILKFDTSPQAQAAHSAACLGEDSNVPKTDKDSESTCPTEIKSNNSNEEKHEEMEITSDTVKNIEEATEEEMTKEETTKDEAAVKVEATNAI